MAKNSNPGRLSDLLIVPGRANKRMALTAAVALMIGDRADLVKELRRLKTKYLWFRPVMQKPAREYWRGAIELLTAVSKMTRQDARDYGLRYRRSG